MCKNILQTFFHELGHTLGLNRPFDNSDGDCIGSTEKNSDKKAFNGLIVMAVKDPSKDWKYLKFIPRRICSHCNQFLAKISDIIFSVSFKNQ